MGKTKPKKKHSPESKVYRKTSPRKATNKNLVINPCAVHERKSRERTPIPDFVISDDDVLQVSPETPPLPSTPPPPVISKPENAAPIAKRRTVEVDVQIPSTSRDDVPRLPSRRELVAQRVKRPAYSRTRYDYDYTSKFKPSRNHDGRILTAKRHISPMKRYNSPIRKYDQSTLRSFDTKRSPSKNGSKPSTSKVDGNEDIPSEVRKDDVTKSEVEAQISDSIVDKVKISTLKITEECGQLTVTEKDGLTHDPKVKERIYLFIDNEARSDEEKSEEQKEQAPINMPDPEKLLNIQRSPYNRQCAGCNKTITHMEGLSWEVMCFCNAQCLTVFYYEHSPKCENCKSKLDCDILGKYYTRQGTCLRNFCSEKCMKSFDKFRLLCFCCRCDMTDFNRDDILFVPEAGIYRVFCTDWCKKQYFRLIKKKKIEVPIDEVCWVCRRAKLLKHNFVYKKRIFYFCDEICLCTFIMAHNIEEGVCTGCHQAYDKSIREAHILFDKTSFCSYTCENIYIMSNRRLVECTWCEAKKYNFNMIKRYTKYGDVLYMCCMNCLALVQASLRLIKGDKTQSPLVQELGTVDGVRVSKIQFGRDDPKPPKKQ